MMSIWETFKVTLSNKDARKYFILVIIAAFTAFLAPIIIKNSKIMTIVLFTCALGAAGASNRFSQYLVTVRTYDYNKNKANKNQK